MSSGKGKGKGGVEKRGGKLASVRNSLYLCSGKFMERPMRAEIMTQRIARYFETQPVLKVWLFGSFARGEQTENSDVDLLVQFDHSSPIGLVAYARMHRELEEQLGCKVDLVEHGTLRPAAEQSAAEDMKVIYERGY